jgi:phage terminase large subunit-like protein
VDLPRLRPDQYAIAMHPAKTKVLSMGRRWGKTVLGGALVGITLQQHGRVAWIAPTFKNTRPMWRWLLQATAADAKVKRLTVSRSERSISTPRGGYLGIYSGENIDSIRGEHFHLVVLDEAARLSEDAWTDAIMPTLADLDGDAVLISTPKGKNWFFREWIAGQQGRRDVQSWIAPTNANPMPTIRRAFERVSERVPERTFRQEWLAEFVDEGSVFRNIAACLTAPFDATLDQHKGHTLVMGCDWGRENDFSTQSVGCVTCRQEVARDRFNQLDYHFQVGRIEAMARRWGVAAILTELNSMGQVTFEMLQRQGLPVIGFTTTAQTKPPLIENMALAFERGEWAWQADPTWTAELEAYERTVSPTTGRSSYSAPAGSHDDTVIARALMLWQAQHYVSSYVDFV